MVAPRYIPEVARRARRAGAEIVLVHGETLAEPVPPGTVRWPWRASLAKAKLAATWNRANVLLPAPAGDLTIVLPIALPAGARGLRVTLLRDGDEHGTRDVGE